jgi:hypothetical protein
VSNSHKTFRSNRRRSLDVGSATQRRVSRPHYATALLVCTCGFLLPACSSSPAPPASNVSADRKVVLTTPPFSTKEPDRYQAIRITSVLETGIDNSSSSQSHQVLIARDGEKRREEYSSGASGQIVHLEIPAGRFLVLPASKIYADISTASRDIEPSKGADDSPELSPDQLLNEAHAPATYEKLGTETLAGRPATKYRVVVVTGTESLGETLIWIDESLGMPVRSETTSKSSGRSSKVTTELKDVKLEVDERLFSWPSDYKKVAARQILDLTRNGGKATTTKQ